MADVKKQQNPIVPKDVDKIIRYLSNMFNMITKNLDRPVWSTSTGANETYALQTEFAYLIHEITMCAPCVMQKHISACNEFIDNLSHKLTK